MYRIIIAGDSYGLGEWGPGTKVTHSGIHQYFNEHGYEVINCAGSGFSLEESLWSLKNCLAKSHRSNDIVLWIQTDPSRSVSYETVYEDLSYFGGLNSWLKHAVQRTYIELDQLGQQYNTVIQAIGGLHDLYVDQSFTNLNFLIKSWIGLLLDQDHPELLNQHFGVVKSFEINRIDLGRFPQQLAQKIVDELLEWHQKSKILTDQRYFNDGFHPNRHGHKILFDHIVYLLELDNLSDQNYLKV